MFKTITLFGSTIDLYNFFNNMSYLVAFILMLVLLKDYKLASSLPVLADKYVNKKKKNKTVNISVFYMLEMIFGFVIVLLFNNLTAPVISKLFLGTSDANYFPNILVGPIVLVAITYIFRVSTLKIIDLYTIVTNSSLICFKIACYCYGCCYGIEYATNFFNHQNERYEIPVQLIELACAVVIFIILFVIRKYKKKDGLILPAYMMLYSGTRFCSEFLRDDYPDIVGPLSGYHLLCIVGFVIGIIYLVVVLKFGNKITEFTDNRNKAYIDKKLNEYNKKHPISHSKKKH